MEGLIGGAIIGLAAVYLGPALVSSLSKVVTPVGEKIAQGSAVAVGAVAGLVSSMSLGVWGATEAGRESKKSPLLKEAVFLKKLKSLAKILRLILWKTRP